MKTELSITLCAAYAVGCAQIAGLEELEPLPESDAGARSVLFDFETGDLSEWPTFQDSASSLALTLVPDPARGTRGMRMDYDVAPGGYAGAEHVFDPDGQWMAQAGLGADVYANATGDPLRFEIYDAGGERFEQIIAADWQGFRALSLPFSSFVKSGFQPTGVVQNDALDLAGVRGLAISPSFLDGRSGWLVIDEISLVAP